MNWYKVLEQFTGAKVDTLAIGKDELGYDFIRIIFDDGRVCEFKEDGQAGWIAANINGDGFKDISNFEPSY